MEDTNTFSQNIDALFNNLQDFTKTEAILGTPLTHGDKTFIPVVSVTLGYGSGSMTPKNQQNTVANPGMGQGVGAKINTDAVIVIDKDNVSMLSTNGKSSNLNQMMDKIPQMLMNMKSGNQQPQQGQQQNQQGQQQNQ